MTSPLAIFSSQLDFSFDGEVVEEVRAEEATHVVGSKELKVKSTR